MGVTALITRCGFQNSAREPAPICWRGASSRRRIAPIDRRGHGSCDNRTVTIAREVVGDD